MKSDFFIFLIGLSYLLTGCGSAWQSSQMYSFNKNQNHQSSFDGNIPVNMKDWQIIVDFSDYWPQCDYEAALASSTLSIDDKNQIWLFGMNWNFRENGIRVPDALNCPAGTDTLPRILRFHQETKKIDRVNIRNLDTDLYLVSARGWRHIGQGKTLLIGVFVYSGPWDTEKGNKNQFIDYAILENDELRDLGWGNTSIFSVPDVAIAGNTLYGVATRTTNVIDVFDLTTEKKHSSHAIDNCDSVISLEAINENLFILCKVYNNFQLTEYSFQILDKGLTREFMTSLDGELEYAQVVADGGGRVWIGHQYIAQKKEQSWYITEILPDSTMFSNGLNTVYFQIPYGSQMLFSMDGGIYLADYDQKKWKFIEHGNGSLTAPFPIAIGPDGKIYAFTGKYIIATTP